MTQKQSGFEKLVKSFRATAIAKGVASEPRIHVEAGPAGMKRRRINLPPDDVTKANPKNWAASDAARRADESKPKPLPPRKGKGRPKAKPPKLATLPWQHETIEDPYDGSRQRAKRVDSAIPRLRRLRIQESPGILRFIQDCDVEASALRTASLDSAGGTGTGTGKVPLAAIEALGRLRALRANLKRQFGEGIYELAYLYLIRGVTIEALHQEGAEQHVVTSGQIREAIWRIEDQYQSGRVRRTYDVARRLYNQQVRGGKQ